ncbi:unnamed protein product [Caenorhabditis bovis]|uniref:PLD phosphodiesterase domain-containing protein n=1 Tax=Caenorhabditis bovis TaxID=2654633 RepID=A0A8S1EUP1_9PELO|nr:unnamed protein product [Caenorhabditis bovis]
MSSDLPSFTKEPPKTRTKLPIYIITAIVIALAVIVLLINLLARSDESSNAVTQKPITLKTQTPMMTTTVTIATTQAASSSESSESSESSTSSDSSTDQGVDNEKSTLTPIPSSTTVNETPIVTSPASTESTTTVGSTESSPTSSASPIPTSPVTPACDSTCRITVVETIPHGMVFPSIIETRDSYEAWSEMFESAQESISIFAYKMNLRGSEIRFDHDNSTIEGRLLYNSLVNKANTGVSVKLIDCNPPTYPNNIIDADEMSRLGLIHRHSLEMNKINGGNGGIHHSKSFIVDGKHLFVGSHNFEWKSFSQKLELGLQFQNCSCIATEADSFFNKVFSMLHGNKLEPTEFKKHVIGTTSVQFLASPTLFLASPDSWDLTQILNLIYEADEFVDISVMQYFPSWIYFKKKEFFSQIDNAIRMSVSRGVIVRILVSGDTLEEQKLLFESLHSLQVLNNPGENHNIFVKFMMVPQTGRDWYKDRKLHTKFILSESKAIVGSSNYAPEYFYKSSGTAVLIEEEPNNGVVNEQLRRVFERYWSSHYAMSLEDFGVKRGYLESNAGEATNGFFSYFGLDQIGLFGEKKTKRIYETRGQQPPPPIILI